MQTEAKLYGLNDTLGTVGQRMHQRWNYGKQRLNELGHNIADKSREVASSTNECVHRNTWKAIGTASAAGLIIGLLLRRR